MSFFFTKKQPAQALAEVLEDGQAVADREMNKPKYNDYSGAEPVLEIAVRVQPEGEPPFETGMKAGLSRCFLLRPGVRVLVNYEPTHKRDVVLVDDLQAILGRNPQLIRKT